MIDANMDALAKYAKIAQKNNMVPIVEPEVIMQGHSIEDCYKATERALNSLFRHLNQEDVLIEGAILKPNMVTSGSDSDDQASPELVERTLQCLKVPDNLPGIFYQEAKQKLSQPNTLI